MTFASRFDYYAALGRLTDELTKERFWPLTSDFLYSACAFDEFAVFLYVWSDAPKRIFDRNPSAKRDHLHGELLQAAYLIGPYYNKLVRSQANEGFYHIEEIIPDAFRESEYHRIYYREKQAADEGMFFIPLEPGTSVGLLAERKQPSPRFEESELDLHRAIAPYIGAVVRQRWKLVEAPTKQGAPTDQQMVTALECFGRELLSDRERQIAELILRGHSSKSGARELGISPETERVHRKRLYSKLDITSQAELFWLFIQSVSYFVPEQRNDPLQALITKKSSTDASHND